MKKKLFALIICLVISCFSVFAQDEMYFRNPGDSRVFHSNGLPFKSEIRPASNGVVPKTNLILGDAIQTGKREAVVYIGNFEIELRRNTLMSIQNVSDERITVYLMDGSVNVDSGKENSMSTREFVVITPVSRFSSSSPFEMEVSSVSTEESVLVKQGSVLAHNFLTKENVALEKNESIDFLKDRNKILSLDSSAISERSAYDTLGIVPREENNVYNTYNNTTNNYTPDPNNKRILSIRLTVGKDGAYISPYDGRVIGVPNEYNDVREDYQPSKKSDTYTEPVKPDKEEPVANQEPQESQSPREVEPRVPSRPYVTYTAENPNVVFDDSTQETPARTPSAPVVIADVEEANEEILDEPVESQEEAEVEEITENPAPKKKSKKQARRPFGIGASLGISSVFDWQSMQNGEVNLLSPFLK